MQLYTFLKTFSLDSQLFFLQYAYSACHMCVCVCVCALQCIKCEANTSVWERGRLNLRSEHFSSCLPVFAYHFLPIILLGSMFLCQHRETRWAGWGPAGGVLKRVAEPPQSTLSKYDPGDCGEKQQNEGGKKPAHTSYFIHAQTGLTELQPFLKLSRTTPK